jgi:hypothetical protein
MLAGGAKRRRVGSIVQSVVAPVDTRMKMSTIYGLVFGGSTVFFFFFFFFSLAGATEHWCTSEPYGTCMYELAVDDD